MKVTDNKCRVMGVHLGEASLNLIRIGEPPVKAKFALMTETGEIRGYTEIASGWSDKVAEALQVFATILEEEALRLLFVMPDDASSAPATAAKTEEAGEPAQF